MDEEIKMFKNDFLLAEIILCGVFNARIGKDCENDKLYESSQIPNYDFSTILHRFMELEIVVILLLMAEVGN